jgi:uncharacterized membrane-anchored protein
MVKTINPVVAVLIGFAGFVIAMVLQFRAKRYNAWIYWLAVVMVAVFGTQAADVLHIKFHVPYAASTIFYAIVLAVIFVLWYRTEGTLSIHSIRTPRREAFYWATVLATFAMGTATGDLTARTLHLGYLTSGILFSVAFLAVALLHWKFGLNPILAFWVAYVLTRPVGASYADYIAFPKSVGGLGVGHGQVATVLTIIIIGFVAYLAVTRKDVEEAPEEPPSGGPARHRRIDPAPGEYPPPLPPRRMDPYSADPRSQDPRSMDPGPGDAWSAGPRSMDPRSGRGWPAEPRPGGAWPGDPRSADPRSGGAWSSDPRSGGAWSSDPRSSDPRSSDPRSSDPRSGGARPGPDRREPGQDPAARPREGFFVWDD